MQIKKFFAGAAVAAGVLGSAAALPGTAGATAGWESYGGDYDASDDSGGRNVFAGVEFSGDTSDYYHASFRAYGEHLYLNDSYAEGEPIVVYLTVEGNGTARFEGEGDGDENLSFDEGLDVSIQVCIGDTGVCSAVYSGGTT